LAAMLTESPCCLVFVLCKPKSDFEFTQLPLPADAAEWLASEHHQDINQVSFQI
jgi:hypothetical protein